MINFLKRKKSFHHNQLINGIMALFCDASCLVKFTRKQGAHIVKYVPYNYDFNGQERFITSCAFPELYDQADSIFAFSIARANCFTWSFIYNLEQYSVVLITHHLLGDTFIRFLQDSRKKLANKAPIEILNQIWLYVTSWTCNSKSAILTVITPEFDLTEKKFSQKSSFFSSIEKQKGIFEVKLDNSVIVYSDFDPFVWIGSNDNFDYLKIWHALMTGKCILIIHDDPSSVSNAVFSVISLVDPFMYCEEYLSFTRIGDPRFAEIINGSTRWKIVGTTNLLAAERCKQFSIVINLSKKTTIQQAQSGLRTFSVFSLPLKIVGMRQTASLKYFFNNSFSASSNEKRKLIKRLTIRLMQKLEDALNEILTINPYSDFLQIPITKDDVSPYFHHHTSVTISSNTESSVKVQTQNTQNDLENSENNDNDNNNSSNSNDGNNNDNDNDNNSDADNDLQKKRIQNQLSINEVIDFSKSQTFKTWRFNIARRSAFRDAMLSETPENAIKSFDLDSLKAVLDVIPLIYEKYERDAHICAVLHRHEKIANKQLKSLIQAEEEDKA